MSNVPGEVRVTTDPRNPGEFFACCGLLELADRLWPCGAEGRFVDACFVLAPGKDGQGGKLIDLIQELATVEPTTLEEAGDDRAEQGDGQPTPEETVDQNQDDEHSSSDEAEEADEETDDAEEEPADKGKPSKVAPLIIRSASGRFEMILDWWMQYTVKKKRLTEAGTSFKTWAANATSKQMFAKWMTPLNRTLTAIGREPEGLFSHVLRVQGSYGFDSRAGWDALQVGFSLNEHPEMKEVCVSPALELLCAVGLQRFLPPVRSEHADVLYSTWGIPLSPGAARVAALGIPATVCLQSYRTRFTSRGSFKGLEYSNELQEST